MWSFDCMIAPPFALLEPGGDSAGLIPGGDRHARCCSSGAVVPARVDRGVVCLTRLALARRLIGAE